ncbi:MAG: site-specific integrase [Candidatus Melainabacteria bacterium]|nr:site-specific integrase [Candidatus Melainabacteria bacterium]
MVWEGEFMSDSHFNFTVERLKKVSKPEPGKRTRVYDEEVRGLIMDVTPGDIRTFYVRKKLNGKTVWHKLGKFPEMLPAAARAAAKPVIIDIEQGRNPMQARRAARAEMTLQDLFDEYIERHAKHNTKTWQDMVANFRRYASPLAGKRLSEVTRDDASRFQLKLRKEKGVYTANRTIQLLRAVFNKGAIWGRCSKENPFDGGLVDIKNEQKRNRFLREDEAAKLIIAARKRGDAIGDFVLLALYTGVRKSNVLAMRWEHINMTARTWTIPHSEMKNQQGQVIILQDGELEILNRRKQEQVNKRIISPFVFHGSGTKTKHLTDPKKGWYALRKEAGVEDCTIHDLRRSLGSALANHNYNLSVIKHALNHKDIKTTAAVYAHVNDEAARQARAVVHATWEKACSEKKEEKGTKVVKAKRSS